MAMATLFALSSLSSMRYHGDWSEMGAKGADAAGISSGSALEATTEGKEAQAPKPAAGS
jgi:hypothetical protein